MATKLFHQIENALTTSFAFPTTIYMIKSTNLINYNYNNLIEMKFSPKYSVKDAWSKEETTTLIKALKDIKSGSILLFIIEIIFYLENVIPQVKNLYYFLSHYILHDRKSAKQVEFMMNQLIRKSLKKN